MTHQRLVLVSLLVACDGGDKPSDAPGTDTDVTDTDPAAADYPSGISFDLAFQGTPVRCGDDMFGMGASNVTARLRDARFFVSDIVLSGPSGEHAFAPTQGLPFQTGLVGLLDFEDGSAECGEFGDARLNDEIVGNIPEGDWDTLTFSVGVPFESNHLQPLALDPPLDLPAMYWSWQGGHKFLRVDLHLPDQPAASDDFNLHIGSAGCASTDALTPPATECDRPNKARISLAFDPFEDDAVVLDVHTLFNGVDVATNTDGSPSGCMTAPNDTAECGPVWFALGMLYNTGECRDDCEGQTAFSTRSEPASVDSGTSDTGNSESGM